MSKEIQYALNMKYEHPVSNSQRIPAHLISHEIFVAMVMCSPTFTNYTYVSSIKLTDIVRFRTEPGYLSWLAN